MTAPGRLCFKLGFDMQSASTSWSVGICGIQIVQISIVRSICQVSFVRLVKCVAGDRTSPHPSRAINDQINCMASSTTTASPMQDLLGQPTPTYEWRWRFISMASTNAAQPWKLHLEHRLLLTARGLARRVQSLGRRRIRLDYLSSHRPDLMCAPCG